MLTRYNKSVKVNTDLSNRGLYMTVTIYNSKDKEQRRFRKENYKLALKVLDRIQGKNGWYAKVEEENGSYDIFHFVDGVWMN